MPARPNLRVERRAASSLTATYKLYVDFRDAAKLLGRPTHARAYVSRSAHKMATYVGRGCRVTELENKSVIFESNLPTGAHEIIESFLGPTPWQTVEISLTAFTHRNRKGRAVLVENNVYVIKPSPVFRLQSADGKLMPR